MQLDGGCTMRGPHTKLFALALALFLVAPLPVALGTGAPSQEEVRSGDTPSPNILVQRSMNATYTSRIPIIDGVMSSNEWVNAESSYALMSMIPPSWEETGGHITGPGIQNDSDASHFFWTMYDEDYLYFLFNCSDDNIIVDNYPDAFWRDDGIEIAIDGAHDKDEDQRTDEGFEDGDTFAVPADGSQGITYSLANGNQYARYWGPNKDWFSAVTTHVSDEYSYYIVEVMIRLNTISNPTPGGTIGLNTGQNDDDDGNTTKEGVIRWQGIDGYAVWKNETLWGSLYFRTHVVADAGNSQGVSQDEVVNFDGSRSSSNHPDFSLTGNYEWTFMYGDEKVTLNGPTPSYQFDRPGQYIVTLNVTDGTGSWDTDTLRITVSDTEDPIADAGPDIIVDQGEPVTLNGSRSSDNHPDFPACATFEWRIIDKVVVRLYGLEVEYTFEDPGQYFITLTVTDPSGNNVATDTLTVTVRDIEPPVADAGEDIVADDGQLVSFDGTGSSDNVQIVKMIWEFELDGEMVNFTGKTPKHKFPVPGVYEVTLVVYDADGQTDSDSVMVTVLDVTAPVAKAGDVLVRNEDVEVTLNGELSWDNVAIVSYEWFIYFDDELLEELSGVKVPHTFSEPGLYDITLRVTDAMGLSTEDTVQYSITDITKPVAKAGESRTVDEYTAVSFSAEGSSDNVGIKTFEWKITGAMGTTPVVRTGESFEYVFTIPGVYTVMLICTDSSDLFSTSTVTITVKDVTDPEVVTPSNVTIKVGQVLELDGRSSTDNVNISKYHWHYEMSGVPFDLYDGNVTILFDAKGNYTITLTVTDDAGNTDSASFWVLVEKPKPPEEEPGFGALLAVVSVTVVAALAVGRRRR